MSAFIKEKEQIVNEIKEKLERASSAVVVDYRGITVAQADLLRKRMREANVEYKIYKNTMLRRAVAGTEFEGLTEALKGPTGIAFGYEDATAPAKILDKSIKEFKHEVNSNGEKKSGISYEKALISDNLNKEFSEEDEEFLMDIIYPRGSNDFDVDDAFGIFIGYQIDITREEKMLSHDKFRKLIANNIIKEIEKIEKSIETRIKNRQLEGHDFYIYIVPFTNIEDKRKEILGEILNWI